MSDADNQENRRPGFLPDPEARELWRFHGGPMDGLEVTAPLGISLAYEVRLANGHCRPFWEAVYTLRPTATSFTAESFMRPKADFDYAPGSQFIETITALEQTLASVRQKLQQRERQINRLEGTIRAMKTKQAKAKKSK